MKKENANPSEWVVHKQRLCQEMLFQRMITDPCMKSCTIEGVRELSLALSKVVSNLMYELEEQESKYLVTDKIANNYNFINGIITMHLFNTGGGRDV